MATSSLIAGYGGTLVFSGFVGADAADVIKVKSFTINIEKDSLEVTSIADFYKRYAPGRSRISGSLTLYRQTQTCDDTLRTHLMPGTLVASTGATLTLKYTDSGGQVYWNKVPATAVAWNIQITSASFTDDGTGAGTWELSWEVQ